jgi:hypothetical protein
MMLSASISAAGSVPGSALLFVFMGPASTPWRSGAPVHTDLDGLPRAEALATFGAQWVWLCGQSGVGSHFAVGS